MDAGNCSQQTETLSFRESTLHFFVSTVTRPANTARCGSAGWEATYSTRKEVAVESLLEWMFRAADREGRCAGLHLQHKPRPLGPRHASLFSKPHAGSVPRNRYWGIGSPDGWLPLAQVRQSFGCWVLWLEPWGGCGGRAPPRSSCNHEKKAHSSESAKSVFH